MSVQTQIDRISGAVSAALAALTEKGVEVPAGTKVDGLASLIEAIEAGSGGKVAYGYFVPATRTGYIVDAYSDEPCFIAIVEYGMSFSDTTHTSSRNVIMAAVKDVTTTSTENSNGVFLYATKGSAKLTTALIPTSTMFQGTSFDMDKVSYIGCGGKTLAYTGLEPGRTYLYVAIPQGGNDA